jgi:RND superfamily putative drug exporter
MMTASTARTRRPASSLVSVLIALIDLSVAIDYSLLVVGRWREECARIAGGSADRRKLTREENCAAIEATMARAGRSVVFSDLTLAVGLLALVAVPVSFLRSTGIAGMLVPLMSVAVTITAYELLAAS